MAEQGIRPQPKIGVAIGCGGAETVAATALFEFIAAENLSVQLLTGCGGGAVMAALGGCGLSPREIGDAARDFWNSKLFSRPDYRTMLNILDLPLGRFHPQAAILRPQAMEQACRRLFHGRRLENLRPATVLQSTDLNTGQGVILDQGDLSRAVYASAAPYPFLPPADIDGQLLTDGSYSSPLPLMAAVKNQMDIILALVFDTAPQEKAADFLSSYWRFINRVLTTGDRSQTALAISLHHYETLLIPVTFSTRIQLKSDADFAAVLAAGRTAVQSRRDEILAIIDNFHPICGSE